MPRLPLLSLAASLALAGCGAEKTTDNAMVDVGNTATLNSAAFNDQAPLVEDADDQNIEAVSVVAVPKPPTGAAAGESAPLIEASDLEDEIRAGTGVQRIRYGDGWAWTREGRIVRTADRDGKNVAYFRKGETRPFFVQRGGRSYAYDGDRPVRAFDGEGRGKAPDANRTREAEDAAKDARDRRDHADQARDRAGQRPQRQEANPAPSPVPTVRGPGRERRGDWVPNPQPSPQGERRPRGDVNS